MPRAIVSAKDLEITPIPQGAVAWWLGTYTNIPSGWEIADGQASANDPAYTRPNLLGRYIKGASALGATGGADTHGHTVPSHAHTTTGASSLENDRENISSNPGIRDHTHGVQNASGTLQGASNHPAHIEGIPIVFCLKAGGSRGVVKLRDLKESALPPRKIVVAWASGTMPSGWAKCDGSTVNGVVTPNLVGKFLKGVPNSGTNPGSTGGASSHAHSTTHTHTTGGPIGGTASTFSQPQGVGATTSHTHTLQAQTLSTSTDDAQPPYVEEHYITFTGHGSNAPAAATGLVAGEDLDAKLLMPRGIVLGFFDTIASIPAKYRLADGGAWANGSPSGYGANRPNMLGRFVKHTANGTTNGGTTGGNDTHSHGADSHAHVINNANANFSCEYNSGGLSATHNHNCNAPSYSSIDTQSNLPPYYEVAWIVRD